MKITVITGPDGRILGTAPHLANAEEGQPMLSLKAGPGQTEHEIELPSELEDVESAEALHRGLEKHLESLGRRQAANGK